MSKAPHPNDNQPDLRSVVASALNGSAASNPEFARSQGLSGPVSPDEISIPCQRTWAGVQTLNPVMNGGDVSACFARLTRDEPQYTYLFLTYRRLGDAEWKPVMMQGGKGLTGEEPQFGGLVHARGHVCTGRINLVPDGGAIRIELADRTRYEDEASEGCCIAFAPITTPPTPDDHFTIRYLNPDGSELHSETRWIGDGTPPPGVRPAS